MDRLIVCYKGLTLRPLAGLPVIIDLRVNPANTEQAWLTGRPDNYYSVSEQSFEDAAMNHNDLLKADI